MSPVELKIQQCRRSANGTQLADLETVNIEQTYQVLNIGDFCNECGNCATFCPTSGAPYRDKAKFHLTKESYDSSSFGYHFVSQVELLWKDGEQRAHLKKIANGLIFENQEIKAKIDPNSYEAQILEINIDSNDWIVLRPAAEMCVLFQALNRYLVFFH